MVDLLQSDPFDLMPIIHMEHDIDDRYLIKKALEAALIRNPIRFFKDAQQVPLVILCDVVMPGMDGFDLRDRIDADPVLRLKAIPFVYFSTWANNELVNKAYQGTIQGYYLKGSNFTDLQAELSLIIAHWK